MTSDNGKFSISQFSNVGAAQKTLSVPDFAKRATIYSAVAWRLGSATGFPVTAGGLIGDLSVRTLDDFEIHAQSGNLGEVTVIWEG